MEESKQWLGMTAAFSLIVIMSSHYIREVQRIKEKHYHNQAQIDVAIRTKRIIDKQFTEKLSLEIIAEGLGQSQFQLIRAFRRYYGMTPRKYLVDRRMIEAKKLLRAGSSVTQACFGVGFESVASFSLLFKNKTGLSPSQWTKAQLSISK